MIFCQKKKPIANSDFLVHISIEYNLYKRFFYTIYAKEKTCKNFKDYSETQSYFNAKKAGWKRLDGDEDAFKL